MARYMFVLIVTMTCVVSVKAQIYVDGVAITVLAGTSVYLDQLDFQNQTNIADGTIDNDGDIFVDGNWTNNATGGGQVFINTNGTGIVHFTNAALQTIGGTETTTFESLTVTNTSVGLQLGNNTTILTVLTLTDGIILSTTTNKLFMATAATTSGASDASFVDGPMTYNSITSSTITFPVGKDSELHRVDLTVNGTSSGYTTEYVHSAATALGHTLPGTLDKVSGVGYWDVTRDAGGTVTTAVVDLYYNANDVVSDAPNLRVAKDDGAGNWVDLGGTGSATPSGNILSTTNFTTFSSFSLANNLGGANALPVELVYFRGKLLLGGVVLEWQTASELNNDFFEIEVSTDAENYITIANIRGQGTTTALNDYEFVDRYPASGLNYYRLRQVDYNGDFEYSNIISVMNDAPAKLYYSAYPQPASTHLTLQLRAIDETSMMNLFIYNINGRIIKHITIDPKTKQLPVDISAFTNGLYLIRLNQAAQAFHGRLLIQK